MTVAVDPGYAHDAAAQPTNLAHAAWRWKDGMARARGQTTITATTHQPQEPDASNETARESERDRESGAQQEEAAVATAT